MFPEKFNGFDLTPFTLGKPVTRELIVSIEARIAEHPDAQHGLMPELITEYYCDGIYAREMFLPKGMFIVGRIHKYAHHNNISMGQVAVATEFDSCVLTAPYHFESLAGTKRFVYPVEDTIWTTYHHVPSGVYDNIVDELTVSTYAEYDRFAAERLKIMAGE